MREELSRLGSARDVRGIADAVADAAARAAGFGSMSFVSFEPGPVAPEDLFVRSSEFPHDTLRQVLAESSVRVEAEMGGLTSALAGGAGVFDPIAPIPRAALERLSVYQDFWRPYRMERQLLAPLRAADEILGFFCVTRGPKERAFSERERRRLEPLRAAASRALAARRALGDGDLGRTIAALAHALPCPAFLFDAGGRLRWMSAEGEVRLHVESVRAGAATLFRGNEALEALRRAAVAGSHELLLPLEGSMRRSGALRAGELLTLRRFEEGGRPMVLVAVHPGAPVAPVAPAPPGSARLSATEARVAALAAEGYTVLNIAARLGIAETTVRTHLRRGYVKLGVHNRAELAGRLLRPRPGDAE